MKTISAVVAALAVLSAPATARAKGLTTVRVCGADSCLTLPAAARFAVSSQDDVLEAPRLAPYYRLDVSSAADRHHRSYSALYVPSSGLIAANAGAQRALVWYVPRTEALAQLHRGTREVEPFAAPSAWPKAVEEAEVPADERSVDWSAVAAVVAPLSAAMVGALRLRRRPASA